MQTHGRQTVCEQQQGEMTTMTRSKLSIPFLASITLSGLAVSALAWAADQPPPEIPTCDKKIGTLAVTEPENKWWLAYNLDSPEALIKVFVSQSQCFTLLDRGKGLAAAQQERALAGAARCVAARTSARAR